MVAAFAVQHYRTEPAAFLGRAAHLVHRVHSIPFHVSVLASLWNTLVALRWEEATSADARARIAGAANVHEGRLHR